jgi:hypothetical protein
VVFKTIFYGIMYQYLILLVLSKWNDWGLD